MRVVDRILRPWLRRFFFLSGFFSPPGKDNLVSKCRDRFEMKSCLGIVWGFDELEVIVNVSGVVAMLRRGGL